MAPFSWNFPGAYVVQFMTVVSCSACLYTVAHYVSSSPDFAYNKTLKKDELSESEQWLGRAVETKRSFFRWLAETRDRAEPGKDTRIFRV